MTPLKLRPSTRLAPALAVFLLTVFVLAGCGPGEPATGGDASAAAEGAREAAADEPVAPDAEPERRPVMIWAQTGTIERRSALREQIHRFNTMQNKIQVDVLFVATDKYDEEVQNAALAEQLPDLMEFDAPHLYKFIERGDLLPLDDLLPTEIRDDLLPSVIEQGTYEGRLYSVAASETGIGLYLNPLKFLSLNVHFPRTPRTAWTAEQFDEILAQLHEENGGEPVLDLKANYTADWFAYALAPAILESAGAGLLDPENLQQAEGVVNSDEAVRAMKMIQSWFTKGYVDPNEDDEAFTSGRVGISLSGHWDFPRYDQALGGAFFLVPLPDFGTGSRTGHGGWSWAIPSQARHFDATMEFLAYMLQPEQIIEMTNATGAVPARRSAIRLSSHYGEEMALYLLARQLEDSFATRPQTPALPEILPALEEAFTKIRDGDDVQSSLDLMAETIDQEIAQIAGDQGTK